MFLNYCFEVFQFVLKGGDVVLGIYEALGLLQHTLPQLLYILRHHFIDCCGDGVQGQGVLLILSGY